MTTMRVTVGSMAYSGLEAIRSTSGNLAELQAQLSSGRRIQRPSDDPTGTVQAMNLRSQLTRNDQYAASSDDALSWLTAADSAYSQIVTVIQQARTLAVQGLNTAGNDATTNEALAQQVDAARSSLLALANTSYNGRPIFGGTTAGATAYDASGAYTGDAGAVTRTVGAQNTVQVNATGPAVFGPSGSSVFDLLSNVSAALRTNPSALSGSLQQFDAAVSKVSTAQAAEGGAYQQVQRAQTAQVADGTAMTTQLSGIEDIDFAATAVKLTTANTAYQAALQTTATVRQLSLLDYLR